MVLESSFSLALLASILAAFTTILVEWGFSHGDFQNDQSPALTATVISITVSVVIFWILIVIRGASIDVLTIDSLLPFLIAGVVNPAVFRVLYFRSINRIGARISAAVVSANPAIAALLALPIFGEPFTVLSGIGLVCIVAGAIVLQISGNNPTKSNDLLASELSNLGLEDLFYPCTAMLLLPISFILVKIGLENIRDPLVGTAISQTVALSGFISIFAISGRWRQQVSINNKSALAAFTLAGAFVAGNWIAWFTALQTGRIITVVPLLNTAPLFIVAISYVIAHQVPKSPRIIIGIVFIVAGATIMQVT